MKIFLATFSAVAMASVSAMAADVIVDVAPVVADAAKPLTITIDNYGSVNQDGQFTSSHELDVVMEGKLNDWTLGAEVWAGLTADYDADTWTIEVPTVMLYGKSDAFGEVDLWDIDGALGNACVQPTAGSTHFGTEDVLTVGTCGGYAGQGVLYISPDFDGFGFQVSALGDLEGLAEAGDVNSAVSAAVTYNKETDDGVTYAASLAIDVATSLYDAADDADLPITIQAGGNIGWDGWVFGAAAQYELNSVAGGDSWGAGVGIGKALTEQFTVTAELAAGGYEADNIAYQEVGLGLTAEYVINDNVSVDGAVNFANVTGDDGSDEDVASVGMGISFAF